MKYILKALNSELKVISEDLNWHKKELKEISTSRLKAIRERDELKRDLELANDIIKDLIEKLNNK